jgi:acetyl-CoA C-acetyltransferase
MVFTLVKSLLDRLGATRDDVDTFVLCSNDFQDGRTISECFTIPYLGAYFKDQTKVDLDGANAVLYGLMRILSGNYDTALIVGYAMGGSEFRNQYIQKFILDPVYDRQVGLQNEISAAALQASAYHHAYGMTGLQLAAIAAKNLRHAANNPHALRKLPAAKPADVLESRPLYSPLHELHMYPPTDGACAVLLAAEEVARKFTDRPVWIKGAANCQDTYYFGDRPIQQCESARKAAQQAYQMAGIKNPATEIDLAEIHSLFASQEPILAEALGLYPEGSGGPAVDEGWTDVTGKLPLNPSGGPLGANPFTAGGLIRVAEAATQLRGEAGKMQVKNARTAVAHGQTGICAQHNVVFVMSR